LLAQEVDLLVGRGGQQHRIHPASPVQEVVAVLLHHAYQARGNTEHPEVGAYEQVHDVTGTVDTGGMTNLGRHLVGDDAHCRHELSRLTV
jgi:hypothetical protein